MKKSLTIAGAVVLIIIAGVYYSNTKIEKSTQKMPEDTTMSFFITSVNPGRGADLGGLAGADAYCTTLSEAVGVKGKTWRAYLSTTGEGGVNARDRIGSGPWYNSAGQLIARTLEQLHGENMISKITALNEIGEQVLGRGDTPNMHDILTGSLSDGTASSTPTTDTTCANWTSSTTGSAIVGHHDRIGINDSAPMKSWNSSHATRGCDMDSIKSTGGAGLFYCFAQ